MRSTMTEYRASSVILVPPHFTISPWMPCGAPFSFTFAMKAGGKLYSRPTRRPIGFGALELGLIFFPCSSVFFGGASSSVPGLFTPVHARPRFVDDMTHNILQIAGCAEHGQLL